MNVLQNSLISTNEQMLYYDDIYYARPFWFNKNHEFEKFKIQKSLSRPIEVHIGAI